MKSAKFAARRPRVFVFSGVAALAFLVVFGGLPGRGTGRAFPVGESEAYAQSGEDPTAAAGAFLKASRVLLHPRCVNCHPAGDRPLVGDQSLPHPMHVVRGPQGLGRNGLWCSGCHSEKNTRGENMPPGAPEWQLPSSDTPMVFEKRTPRQLCEQLKDPTRNGSRSPAEVLEHVRQAPLVRWGWQPGDGRTPAPLTHEEFVKLISEWVEKGAACPK